MQIQVHGQGLEIEARLRSYVEERIQAGLTHIADQLTRVEVHLRDLNGDKGGIDKRCTCEARPRGMDPVVVEHDSNQVTDAVQGAVAKLQRALRNRFDKRSAHR